MRRLCLHCTWVVSEGGWNIFGQGGTVGVQ